MYRTLIVARMIPGSAPLIAHAFHRSDDEGELPAAVGIHTRSLFQFGELYLHLMEGVRPVGESVSQNATRPEFRRISEELRPHVTPYLPTWYGPQDAMAQEFYHWKRDDKRDDAHGGPNV
jgi:cyclase